MVRMRSEVVADGLDTPEGPQVMKDGSVVFVQQRRGAISRLDESGVSDISVKAGSPNSVALGQDGFLYAAQNGGVVGDWRSPNPETPSIEKVSMSGEVARVASSIGGVALGAPNDLVFGPDEMLYFTDPGEGYSPNRRLKTNRIFSLSTTDPSASSVVIELPPSYVNGIGFLVDGRLCWVESYFRTICVLENSTRSVIATLPERHVPDGFDVADDGRIFIATVESHGISVISPEGQFLEHLDLDGRALPTNCVLEGSALWVTDFGIDFSSSSSTGRLWRLEVDAVARAPHPEDC